MILAPMFPLVHEVALGLLKQTFFQHVKNPLELFLLYGSLNTSILQIFETNYIKDY